MREKQKIRVLFVCYGNICRSPMAEAVFKSLITTAGLAEHFEVESSGFAPHLLGRGYHPLTIKTCEQHGVPISGTSRPTTVEDLEKFDYLLAMDSQNFSDLLKLDVAEKYGEKIHYLLQFSLTDFGDLTDVPDPVSGPAESFEHVYHLVQKSCEGLLGQIRAVYNI